MVLKENIGCARHKFRDKKMKQLVWLSMVLCTVSILVQSCKAMKEVPRTIEEKTIDYSVNLNKVELPKNSNERFGDIITIEINRDSTQYSFEDDNMKILWFVGDKYLYFTIFNKSNYPIKINWDDVVFVDTKSEISRVIHSGIDYNKINETQAATIIPRGAIFKDYLIPVNNVKNNHSVWDCYPLIYKKGQTYNSREYSEEEIDGIIRKAEDNVGLTFSVLFPVIIKEVQNDYTFVFRIEKTAIKVTEKTIIEQVPDIQARKKRTAFVVAGTVSVTLANVLIFILTRQN